MNIDQVNKIYDKHYKTDFSKPDFVNDQFVSVFQVDIKDQIVTAGGIRLIPEIVLVTDKDAPVLNRKLALTEAIDFMVYHAQQLNYSGLHAFVEDELWARRLQRTGFKTAKGQCLILEV